MTRSMLLLASTLLLVAPSPALAFTAVSNLGEAHGEFDLQSISSSQWFAGGFVTGADALTLSAVTIWLGGSGGGGNTFAMTIYDNSGLFGNPGSPIANGALSGSTNPGAGLQTYTGNASLAPNTFYWAVASVSNGFYGWFRTSTNAETSPVDWTIANSSVFSSSSLSSGWGGTGSEVQFSVDVVPEPSTAILLGFGLLGLAVGERRRESPRHG